MLREKSCGAVVFRNVIDSRGAQKRFVLMIKQRTGSHFSFPKGHVESGESEIQTAEREVFEETSVKIRITENFRSVVNYCPRPGTFKEVVYFVAETDICDILPQEGEISEVKWVDVNKAESILAHANDRRVFVKALEYVNRKHQ